MLQNHIDKLGKIGCVILNGSYFDVRILDAKETWGKLRFLVEPVAGLNSFWTEKILPAQSNHPYGDLGLIEWR